MIEALAVVVPARDEEELIVPCLHSVLAALDRVSLPSLVVVVANRCTDATALLALGVLERRGIVVQDDAERVGAVRHRGVAEALRRLPVDGAVLLLSTDADTTVPADWALRLLGHAHDGVAAVAGLTELDDRPGLSPQALHVYDDLVAAGIHGVSHGHAYAANLAVRSDAYLAVGGWPVVRVGEEHALLGLLEDGGWPVRRVVDVVVRTSARCRARAQGGLGDLLNDLPSVEPEVV
ncbi:glycosyltransferase [Spongisporangium articulatum]|uniref:4,4'-diaponeurosporenoate glycosyltransferase n=1 Tax=Spongisporangium articulatum TaxID=3362603 RepID=A0ABW8AJ06_9ACTN